jgi:Protein of unknown function (DUF664)
MSFSKGLSVLFHRDLARLNQQIEAFPDDSSLWSVLPGITNSAGNLVLHIEGNLKEFVARQLGKLPYKRERELEFTSKGFGKEELAARIGELQKMVPSIIAALSLEQVAMEYPRVVLEKPLSTQDFLIHLYGHLNWHLGQIDYVRRIVTGTGALKAAGL